MCGICGMVRFDGQPVDRAAVFGMTQALYHRGPDDEGFYFSSDKASAGLGFRRLSIIDVQGGHQPMQYKDLTIVFNGEIYNYKELRKECESRGDRFLTQSDTEVILHLVDRLGEKALEKLNGMFAFAIWDEKINELFLARDRMGIKPLYYASHGQAFAFASELKSLYLSKLFSIDFDPTALFDFFSYRFVPGPHTVLQGVKKVLPGRFIRIRESIFEERTYWKLTDLETDHRSFAEIKPELELLIQDSVRSQMASDVPFGAFLSGGVDSSLVTAFMARNSQSRIQTFSIGFEKETGVDESDHARAVAQYLGTEHHELILTEKDFLQSDKVFLTMTEPVADSTILPTAILSEFTRKTVTVALTGEGGDELFGGYNRYKDIAYPVLKLAPGLDPKNWFPHIRDFPEEELAGLFPAWTKDKTYLGLEHPFFQKAWSKDPLNQILELERQTSLVDRLLMKVDMASMSHSLEARPPYLDHRIVEFAHRIPSRHKIRWFKGKYILRKIAEKHLPADICWRRKHGFIVPIWKWILARGKDWLPSLIDPSFLGEIPGISPQRVQNRIDNLYNRKITGKIAVLWPLAVLAMWRKSLKS